MKGSANLPLPLRVHEAPRAGNKAPPNAAFFWFPRAQQQRRRGQHSPSSRPVGGEARQSLPPPYLSGDQTSQPDEEEATRFPAPTGVPSLSVLRSLCLRAAYTNSRLGRTRVAVSEVDLVQGSTGEARPRGSSSIWEGLGLEDHGPRSGGGGGG
ncbi:hypothetical protein LY76DRAFT_659189, partial [Colletotrichum caudatum]